MTYGCSVTTSTAIIVNIFRLEVSCLWDWEVRASRVSHPPAVERGFVGVCSCKLLFYLNYVRLVILFSSEFVIKSAECIIMYNRSHSLPSSSLTSSSSLVRSIFSASSQCVLFFYWKHLIKYSFSDLI